MPDAAQRIDSRAAIADLFGVDVGAVDLASDRLHILGEQGERSYDVVDGVVILVDRSRLSADTRARLPSADAGDRQGARDPSASAGFAPDIQRSFGREWDAYRELLPEHKEELLRYFDLVDLDALGDKRLIDLGCGSGRWSMQLVDRAREIVLVDYSDAIFVARDNLRGADNCLFFLGDITELPFRDDCADLAYSLGVLQTLPMPCLDVTRQLGRLARELLVFVYYALENRPAHWRAILAGVTVARKSLAKLRDEELRRRIAHYGAVGLYQPLVALGNAIERVDDVTRFARAPGTARWASQVPLWDAYHGMSTRRIEQDVYDRFFTSIEQRVTRDQIRTLRDTFDDVVISDGLPYWHFVCRRGPARTKAPSGAAGR